MELLHPAMWHDHDIDFARWLNPAMWHVALELWQWIHQVAGPYSGMTCRWQCVALPGGSTLQCGRWLWGDMPWNSPKRQLYWNSTSGFNFDNITAVDMSFCNSLWNSIKIGPPSAEKLMSCQFSRWRISAILDFSFFENPMYDLL